jgi:4'-phosphopantetheinyl transferase
MDLLWRQLQPGEIERAQRYRFERHRRRFVVARGMLRVILARYTGLPPAAIRFETTEHGKPWLPDSPELTFNASDSREWMALGVTLHRRIGVDIELVREDVSILSIARRFFSPREVAVLEALPDAEQLPAFFRCWTRKEAFIKAIGEGLSYPLDQFDVTLGPDEPARLTYVAGEPDAPQRWWMMDFPMASGYAGAVITETPLEEVRFWAWPLASG